MFLVGRFFSPATAADVVKHPRSGEERVRIFFLGLLVLILHTSPLFALTLAGTGDSEALLQRLATEYHRLYPDRSVAVPSRKPSKRLLLTPTLSVIFPFRRSRTRPSSNSPLMASRQAPRRLAAKAMACNCLWLWSGKSPCMRIRKTFCSFWTARRRRS